jgi:hypothetical protein
MRLDANVFMRTVQKYLVLGIVEVHHELKNSLQTRKGLARSRESGSDSGPPFALKDCISAMNFHLGGLEATRPFDAIFNRTAVAMDPDFAPHDNVLRSLPFALRSLLPDDDGSPTPIPPSRTSDRPPAPPDPAKIVGNVVKKLDWEHTWQYVLALSEGYNKVSCCRVLAVQSILSEGVGNDHFRAFVRMLSKGKLKNLTNSSTARNRHG